MIYLSSDDGQQTEGVYSDPEEAVSQELEQAGLSEQDFEKPEQAQENDICFLTSARTGDSWTTGEFSGEVQDYTDVRIRLEELGIYWEEESASKEETGSMKQLVADEEVEAQTLHVREVFNEQVACTAAGTYEQADLGNGFTAWLDCGKIMVIKTRVEDVTDAYEEIYNFEDGKLIFAFEKEMGKSPASIIKTTVCSAGAIRIMRRVMTMNMKIRNLSVRAQLIRPEGMTCIIRRRICFHSKNGGR